MRGSCVPRGQRSRRRGGGTVGPVVGGVRLRVVEHDDDVFAVTEVDVGQWRAADLAPPQRSVEERPHDRTRGPRYRPRRAITMRNPDQHDGRGERRRRAGRSTSTTPRVGRRSRRRRQSGGECGRRRAVRLPPPLDPGPPVPPRLPKSARGRRNHGRVERGGENGYGQPGRRASRTHRIDVLTRWRRPSPSGRPGRPFPTTNRPRAGLYR